MLFKEKIYCPKCHDYLSIKPVSFMEIILGGCAIEIGFWIFLGIIASIFVLSDWTTAVAIVVFMSVVYLIIIKYFTQYFCEFCQISYEKKKNKIVRINMPEK